ncbi:MAG: NUDIX hydrolase [Candidatus Tyrphobacter sp.]
MEKPAWRLLDSHYVVDSRFMRIRQDRVALPNGTVLPEYFVRESAGFVIVFATTPDDRVILVRQYRYGADSIGLELPAGMIEPGEEPAACAARELLEETGYRAQSLSPLASYAAEPVRSTARAFLFNATGATSVANQALDPTEHIEVELVPLAQFATMLAQGHIDSIASVAAGYRGLAQRTYVR